VKEPGNGTLEDGNLGLTVCASHRLSAKHWGSPEPLRHGQHGYHAGTCRMLQAVIKRKWFRDMTGESLTVSAEER
jgi:hypothetical protein